MDMVWLKPVSLGKYIKSTPYHQKVALAGYAKSHKESQSKIKGQKYKK
jgi:hypothetical protein